MSGEPRFTAFFDGCCPVPGGPMGFGAVVVERGHSLPTFRQAGMEEKHPASSTVMAEYRGLHLALDYFVAHGLADQAILICGDSRPVIAQLFGDEKQGGRRWRIGNGPYAFSARMAAHKLSYFRACSGKVIPHGENAAADLLCKKPLVEAGIKVW